ncbi:hypothetical protein DN824_20525 [Stutzerimonas nosocomialis]|uniref:hypothetical protein n=1 Tax=Stutzerimonas nosocomialis TaxID=1056496 RepID=UPI001107E783|nr:hypothetical protein [Stutzerimonas nosocomialis]TLX54870.1 hypothetical protein DN824_20525 [Stutzerimonas nosocomialis]
MHVNVRAVGVELAARRLEEVNRKVEPVLRGALNTTVTKTRTTRYIQPMRGSIKGARLRSALRVKRANTRRMEARIIPSSSGILVLNYQSWGYDEISPTRARIWVRGPNGRKVAAGFVNPASNQKLPWSTQGKQARGARGSAKWALRQSAIGPSAAYWFRLLTTNQTLRWTNTFLQQEFEKRVKREIAKGAR